MCVTIWNNGKEIQNFGELKELVGDAQVIFDDEALRIGDLEGDTREDEWCLCGVDIEATMKRAGYDVKMDESFMYYDVTAWPSLPTRS